MTMNFKLYNGSVKKYRDDKYDESLIVYGSGICRIGEKIVPKDTNYVKIYYCEDEHVLGLKLCKTNNGSDEKFLRLSCDNTFSIVGAFKAFGLHLPMKGSKTILPIFNGVKCEGMFLFLLHIDMLQI